MKGIGRGVCVLSVCAALPCCARHREPTTIRHFDAPGAALAYAQARRAPLGGEQNTSRLYARAAERRDGMPRFASRIDRSVPFAGGVSPTAVLDAWTPLGPGNIGGRTRVIRYHPTRRTTLFAAGVSGGVWRSDNDGTSWRPTSDGLSNLAINALAIDPRQPDVMYAGTGEGYFREEIRGTGLPLRGSGIFVTRDGGARWQRLASTATDDFLWVNDLEIGVGDSRRVYAATRTGVWRSADAGATWTRLLSTTVRGGCLDLALRPDRQDDVLFASCGSYEQATVYRWVGASGGAAPEVVLRTPGMGRTSLAIAPARPDTMYALSASNDPGPSDNYRQALLAVYRSDGGGAAGTWEARVTNSDPVYLHTLLLTNAPAANVDACAGATGRNSFTNMGWYTNVIGIDPRDPDRVWAAGVDWFRSDDGGRTWGMATLPSAGGAHVDQHAIAFHPDYNGTDNQIAIIANDGGLARTTNARAATATGPRATCSPTSLQVRWTTLDRDYGVTQFYYGLPFPDGAKYLGGAQDNSTLIGSDQGGVNGWQSALGGDGGYVAVHPTNPLTIYAESQFANIAKSIDGGVRFASVTRGLDAPRFDLLGPDANFLFVTPFVMDPANADRLWLGGELLYRTTDAAASWTKASTAMPDGGLVSTIAVAPFDPDRIVAGTTRGDVVWSTSALAATAATRWDSTRPRAGWVTSVAFDPRAAMLIYATYGNFGGAHVYRSTTSGLIWDALDGEGVQRLPDIPVHSLVVDPDDSARLYLGTDLGVFVSLTAGRTWMVEETGFGPAVVEWLALHRDTAGRKRLYAFTHGRGAWRVDLR